MIHHGDCLDVMAGMEPESVDAVVTDPPYGLEFMGKSWDTFKATGDFPGGGPKGPVGGAWATAHGTTAKGFDGYPVTPRLQGGAAAQAFHARWAREAFRVAKPSAYLLAFGGTRTVHRMACAIEDAGWIIRDMLVWAYASGFPKSKASLKPAWEPIVMARKPGPLRMLAIDECRIPAAADDLADWHAGYDGPKFVGNVYGESDTTGTGPKDPAGRWPANLILTDPIFDGDRGSDGKPRWDGVVGGGETRQWNPEYEVALDRVGGSGDGVTLGLAGHKDAPSKYGDSGTYSRFFLIPKADRGDREPVLGGLTDGFAATTGNGIGGREHNPADPRAYRQNVHPTVKPTELMRHLVRLVTPAGGTVLDPFLGSGTTGLACELEGFPWIGIEKEAEYVAIAEARLNGTQRGLGLVG